MTPTTVSTAAAPPRPRSGVVSVVLMVLLPVVAVASFAVMAAAGGQLVASHVLVGVVVGSVSAVLGGYLVARLPGNPMGWLFALSGVAYVASVAVSAWVTAAQVWEWPGVLAAAWVSEWVYVLALGPQLTFLLLLFPDGFPPSPRWRLLAWASGGVIAALVVSWMLTPEIHLSQDELVPNPFVGSEVAAQLTGPLVTALGLCGLASFASLMLRLHRAAPGERRRIAPYVVAATLVIIAIGATPPLSTAGPYVQTVVLPLLPIAATVCVLRYRLYDLEIRRPTIGGVDRPDRGGGRRLRPGGGGGLEPPATAGRPGLGAALAAPSGPRLFPDLSDREFEVLELLARGWSTDRITAHLFLSPKTVRNNVSAVLTKLGVSARAEAVAVARDAGIAAGPPIG